jgi:hypothetical protein
MRTVTNKAVQIHFECACGYNVVDHDSLPIKWRDLSKAGIIRKKDKSTGKPFLLHKQKSDVCQCNEIN